MADAIQTQAAVGERYYTTSYSLGTGTTSTLALRIWREMSNHLLQSQIPLTGSQLMEIMEITQERLDVHFEAPYYQKHYGFKRFDSLESWREWAEQNRVLYVPGLHDAPSEAEELADEDLADESEEENG